MDDDEEFDLLRRRADELNLFLQRHRNFDPCCGNGEFYIMEKRKSREQHCRSFIRYSTAEACWAFLNEYARGEYHGNDTV